jgi:hypothetical protein
VSRACRELPSHRLCRMFRFCTPLKCISRSLRLFAWCMTGGENVQYWSTTQRTMTAIVEKHLLLGNSAHRGQPPGMDYTAHTYFLGHSTLGLRLAPTAQ